MGACGRCLAAKRATASGLLAGPCERTERGRWRPLRRLVRRQHEEEERNRLTWGAWGVSVRRERGGRGRAARLATERAERAGLLTGPRPGDAALQALDCGLIGLRPKRKEREAARDDGSVGRLEQHGRSGSRPMGRKRRKEK